MTDKLVLTQEIGTYSITKANILMPIGYWCLYDSTPNTMFAIYQKPTDEQIANTEKLLGWKWRDAE